MLNEGLEKRDLARLVHPELHIDEFKSKLGRDEDVCVISFKVAGKEPALDLANFIEKGYEWIVDADVSSGEMRDGDYIVFVEADRNKKLPEHIMEMMNDIMNLTDQNLDEWRVRYRTEPREVELSIENLASLIPLDADEYEKSYGSKEIDKLKAASGVKVKTLAPKNEMTESLRIAAGLR